MDKNILMGFRKIPENLELILTREGYTNKEQYGDFTCYTREKYEWPQLILCDPSQIQVKREFWDKSKLKNIILELAINYNLEEGTIKEAKRLSWVIKKEIYCFVKD